MDDPDYDFDFQQMRMMPRERAIKPVIVFLALEFQKHF